MILVSARSYRSGKVIQKPLLGLRVTVSTAGLRVEVRLCGKYNFCTCAALEWLECGITDHDAWLDVVAWLGATAASDRVLLPNALLYRFVLLCNRL